MAPEYPTKPTLEMPYFQDGEYGPEINRISPEGNAWGSIRMVQAYEHEVWWDGASYRLVDAVGQALSFESLPATQRPFGQVWDVRFYNSKTNEYYWKKYFWDSSDKTWNPLHWLWIVDSFNDLPRPGIKLGAAHVVRELNVLTFWDGEYNRRLGHKALDNDEPELHLPPGFLKWYKPDAKVTFVNPNELVLEATEVGSGQIWVAGEYVQAQPSTAVFSNLAALDWDSQNERLVPTLLEPDTDYWLYLANTKAPEFWLYGIVGIPNWDYRGKLFASNSPDVSGYLSAAGVGSNARLVGQVTTDATPRDQGGPLFLREINISLISRTVSFPETLRDHSDYRLEFVDQTRIRFALQPGLYGQIYVGGNLEYIGVDYEVRNFDPIVQWSDSSATIVSLKEVGDPKWPLRPGATYYIYISARVDEFNFNAVNPDTNRPWQADDENSAGHYDPDLDLRLRPFLSDKAPENERMSDQWPGFYTREIGVVRTDQNGAFINARDLSIIRAPMLNPVYFDGLAEIAINGINSTEFQVCAKRGTSGIVNVGGEGIQTYEQHSSNVHRVLNTDGVFAYMEGNLSNPLTQLDQILDHPIDRLYVYLANSRVFWGPRASKVFVTSDPPQAGYLSVNWPGNNARWIATLQPDGAGSFTGSFIVESIASVIVTIDDFDVSLTKVWSSAKVNAEITALTALVSGQMAYSRETTNGLPLKLAYKTPTKLSCIPTLGDDVKVFFPDLSSYSIPAAGMEITVTGDPYTLYYVYLTKTGSAYCSTAQPDNKGPKLHCKGNDILLGYFGLITGGGLGGSWSVYSFWNEPAATYTRPQVDGYSYLNMDGFVVPPDKAVSIDGTGTASYHANLLSSQEGYAGCTTTINGKSGQNSCHAVGAIGFAWVTAYVSRSLSQNTLEPGVYRAHDIWTLNSGYYENYGGGGATGYWTALDGNLILTVEGS